MGYDNAAMQTPTANSTANFSLVRLGAIAAFLGVGLGAFGAHSVRDHITPEMLAVYQTGVQYHLLHALALLFVGLFSGQTTEKAKGLVRGAGTLFITGIVLFSGSLYALALTGIRKLGIITPLGGVCFLTGWALLAAAAHIAASRRAQSDR
jgi:uncharacterized membrane protein YgdD (TMEM256/DUF423 family)